MSDLLTADEEAAIKERHRPAGPCSCGDRRWTNDENWESNGRTERTRADGLIPCGFCNEAGWDTPEYAPREPFCPTDDQPWPCDAARLLLSFAAVEDRVRAATPASPSFLCGCMTDETRLSQTTCSLCGDPVHASPCEVPRHPITGELLAATPASPSGYLPEPVTSNRNKKGRFVSPRLCEITRVIGGYWCRTHRRWADDGHVRVVAGGPSRLATREEPTE